jgi:hypothetical protein
MAHQNPIRIRAIPATVAFRPTPCTWSQEADRQFRIQRGANLATTSTGLASDSTNSLADAWKLRSAFLNLKSDQEFLDLLNQTGLFFRLGTYDSEQAWSVERFRLWQRTLKVLLTRRPTTWSKRLELVEPDSGPIQSVLWLHGDFTLEFRWQEERVAVFVATETLTAMLASIYIDHLRGAKFRICVRPDCARAFECTSKHRRRYCSTYCAHLESLRRLRARRGMK